jgi:hypothetical protein
MRVQEWGRGVKERGREAIRCIQGEKWRRERRDESG